MIKDVMNMAPKSPIGSKDPNTPLQSLKKCINRFRLIIYVIMEFSIIK